MSLSTVPLCRCSLSRSQQQKYESPDSGSTWGHISWAASIFWKRMRLVWWYVEGANRCHPTGVGLHLFYAPSWLPAIPLVSSSARNGTADTLVTHVLDSSSVLSCQRVCVWPHALWKSRGSSCLFFLSSRTNTLSRHTAGLTVAPCSCCSVTERATFLITSCNMERLCLPTHQNTTHAGLVGGYQQDQHMLWGSTINIQLFPYYMSFQTGW